MRKWNVASLCAPLLGLYGAEAYEHHHGPVQMGDFKIFGEGGNKLVSDLRKAVGVENEDFNGLEENLPTPPEASILRGASAVEVEPESMLEMNEGDEAFESDDEAEKENRFGDGDEEEEEEEEGEGSFLEGHSAEHEDLEEDWEDSEMYVGESEDEAEEEEDEQMSFLEGQTDPEDPEDFQEDAASWDEDEEDWESEEAAVDPYLTEDSAMQGPSYLEEDAEAVDEENEESAVEAEEEEEEEKQQLEEEAEISFIENTQNEEEEDAAAGSFIQLTSTRNIRAHNHNKESSSFVDSGLNHETTDQTTAEDEMLREAGSPPDDNESAGEGGPVDSPVDEGIPETGISNDFSAQGLDREAQTGDEQADEDYRGPADPVKYGGNTSEDVETEDIETATTHLGEANGPESLRARAEEAGAEQEEMPESTEEELASDLQGSFPRIEAARPHVVQRRHVEQDIKMTEALRTESTGEKAISGSPPTSFTALTIVCASLAFLWL